MDGDRLTECDLYFKRSYLGASVASSGAPEKVRRLGLNYPVYSSGDRALRIALGGEMIVRIATDETLGKTLDDRLGWLHSQLKLLRSKLGTLIAAKADTANV